MNRDKTMQMLKRFLIAVSCVAITACGGGGGGGSPFGGDAPGTPPQPPGGGGTGAVASDISLSLSAPSLANTGTDAVTVTVTAVDANRNTVGGIPVTLAVDNDATIATSGTSTNTSGLVTGTVRIGSSRANRTVNITATSGSLVRTIGLQIVGTRITATPLPAVIAPSSPGVVQFRVVDAAGNGVAGAQIVVTGPTGTATPEVTAANGDYEYRYTSPATAGTITLRAAAGGAEQVATVLVQSGSGSIPPVRVDSVRSASVAANPRVVVVNGTAATNNRAEVRALFVGDSNAPIQNIRVRFDLDGDQNSIGGAFSTGDTIVYSDQSGSAISAYIPASRFSPTDGVTVRACWDYTDFPIGSCPNEAVTTLTVISDALSVSIGTDNLIGLGDLVYTRRFVVQVNDSSGLPKADVLISPLLDLTAFRKGFWNRPPGADEWEQVVLARCDNEDINRNGVLEIYSSNVPEDADGDGQLEPRKADAIIAFEGGARTNSNGQVRMRITYPQNVASWVDFNLLVAASGVAGTEGRANFQGALGVPISAVEATERPPFVVSPYGVESGDAITVFPPTVPAQSVLCRNPN
jgi:hypothetical protein